MPDLTRVKGGWSVRIRCGAGQNPRFVIALKDETAARRRADRLRELARLLVAAGKTEEAPLVVRKGAAQPTEEAFRQVEIFVAELCKDVPKAAKAATALVTVRQLGEQ